MSQTAEAANQLVYAFSRAEQEQIQLALRPYKGRFYIDLRLWYQEVPEGAFAPTKKGISFSTDLLPELREGIRRLEEACREVKPRRQDSIPRGSSSSRPQSFNPRLK